MNHRCVLFWATVQALFHSHACGSIQAEGQLHDLAPQTGHLGVTVPRGCLSLTQRGWVGKQRHLYSVLALHSSLDLAIKTQESHSQKIKTDSDPLHFLKEAYSGH